MNRFWDPPRVRPLVRASCVPAALGQHHGRLVRADRLYQPEWADCRYGASARWCGSWDYRLVLNSCLHLHPRPHRGCVRPRPADQPGVRQLPDLCQPAGSLPVSESIGARTYDICGSSMHWLETGEPLTLPQKRPKIISSCWLVTRGNQIIWGVTGHEAVMLIKITGIKFYILEDYLQDGATCCRKSVGRLSSVSPRGADWAVAHSMGIHGRQGAPWSVSRRPSSPCQTHCLCRAWSLMWGRVPTTALREASTPTTTVGQAPLPCRARRRRGRLRPRADLAEAVVCAALLYTGVRPGGHPRHHAVGPGQPPRPAAGVYKVWGVDRDILATPPLGGDNDLSTTSSPTRLQAKGLGFVGAKDHSYRGVKGNIELA